MDACETRHFVHLLLCGVDVAVLQVVEDGVVEQNGILTTTTTAQLEEKNEASENIFYCSRDRNRGLQIQRQG